MDYTIYSEEEYYDRMQLLSIYNPTACNCIWEEIISYRKLFQYDFMFYTKRQYITLNKTLFKKMMNIYQLTIDEDFQNASVITFCDMYKQNKKDCILHYLELHQIPISHEMLQFLLEEELFLLQLFIVHTHFKSKNFTDLFLYLNKQTMWSSIIQNIDVQIESLANLSDVTKHFRQFLDSFYFNSFKNMVKLKSTILNKLSEEELITRYPMCNQKQISFYLQHCQMLHYYTIAHYKAFHNVSYESARKAMEQLVSLHFYNKVKIGKKFVFTPVE